MLKEIIMPQGSQDLVPGRVVRWNVAEGSPVKKGEVICEVETEKAVFEINSPADGYLRKIVTPAGDEADVFATIGYVGDLSDPLPGEGPEAAPAAALTAAPATAEAAPSVQTPAAEGAPRSGRVRITPLAKRIAKDMGLDYTKLSGSGPNGRIVAVDVRAAKGGAAARAAQATAAEPATATRAVPLTAPAPAAPAPIAPSGFKVDTSAPGQMVTLNKIRKVMAQRMQMSKQVAPHFYVTVSVDMTEALQYREVYNKRPGLAKEDKLSVNDMIVRACALALKEFPQVNSSVVDENTLMLWEDIHIGIATALDDGLVVPVLEHADWLSLAQLPSKTRRLINLAKEGKQASLAPSRFTVSNLGMFNVDSFSAIINPPEVAILAVASIEKRVMPPKGEQLGVRLREMMSMTVSLDHRAGDGVLAARFANRVRELLETPQLLE
jgi:pyruvate dehydrogenase E2 component (dihydrolipoamide acetyltransferase)